LCRRDLRESLQRFDLDDYFPFYKQVQPLALKCSLFVVYIDWYLLLVEYLSQAEFMA